MAEDPQVVILAAGSGTRMRSAVPKVLHPLAGRTMIDHVLTTAAEITAARPIVVLSPSQPEVRATIEDRATCVEQAKPLGTGDALRAVPEANRHQGLVVVLYSDVPLLRAQTLRALLDKQRALDSACVLLAAAPADPGPLGRLVRSANGRVTEIVEASELDDVHGDLHEINAGAYSFKGSALWPLLDGLTADNAKGEVFLTDLIPLLGGADTVELDDPEEAIGVNDRVQLARAEAVARRRILEVLMLSGVTVEDPATTYIDAGVRIGQDSVVKPMTSLTGNTKLGSGCVVGPGSQLHNVSAGDNLIVGTSVLTDCTLGNNVEIGHFNRIRPDSNLHDRVSLGTHAEVKNSTIGSGSRINHFACVLDSEVGEDVNIGAGTVTCNFDGQDKSRTVIGNRVFVGTNSTLIAPVALADDSYIAAGSVISNDVPAGALGVGRSHQRNIGGWSERRAKAAKS